MNKLYLTSLVLAATIVLVALPAPEPASAIGWYNTVNVVPTSQTIKMTNKDNRTFSVAARGHADNIAKVWVPAHRCLRVDSSNSPIVKNYSGGTKGVWVNLWAISIGALLNLKQRTC